MNDPIAHITFARLLICSSLCYGSLRHQFSLSQTNTKHRCSTHEGDYTLRNTDRQVIYPLLFLFFSNPCIIHISRYTHVHSSSSAVSPVANVSLAGCLQTIASFFLTSDKAKKSCATDRTCSFHSVTPIFRNNPARILHLAFLATFDAISFGSL